MKYLLPYKIYESYDEDWSGLSRERKMGKLLHLYSSIPLRKEKASEVIKSIVKYSKKNFSIYDKKVITPWNKLHDRLRFNDYFNSLLSSKDTRGHNFEGLIAGLFDGEIQSRGSRADIILKGGERCSIKFIDSKSEAPVLGSIYASIKDRPDILEKIGDRSIYEIFNTISVDEEKFREEIFDLAFGGVDLFLIGYATRSSQIELHVIKFENMKENVCAGLVVAPKVKSAKWSVRISSSAYRNDDTLKIKIPTISMDQLDSLWSQGTRKWSKTIFGNSITNRLRTDVIEDIIDDKEEIVNNLEIDILKTNKE